MTLFHALSSSLSFLKPNKVCNFHNNRFTVTHHCQENADLRQKGYLVWFFPASKVQKSTYSTPASQQSNYGIKFTVWYALSTPVSRLPRLHKLLLQLPRTVQNGECNTIPKSYAADDPSLTQDVLQSTESTDSLLARVMLGESSRGPPR